MNRLVRFSLVFATIIFFSSCDKDEIFNEENSSSSIQAGFSSNNELKSTGWENFQYPNIHFTNKTIYGNGSLYAELIPNEQAFIRDVCLRVCKQLFKRVNEVNSITDITYIVEDNDGISGKWGAPPHISISFSSRYLMKKKNEGLTNAELIKEIEGVLVHEVTHAYQYEPKGAGNYANGTDFFGFIEGVADYVRYVEGFTSISRRSSGGNWRDGYNTSAFFIDWLHTKDNDFAYKFNQTAEGINPWSWERAIESILGSNVYLPQLWNEYQSDLSSGRIFEIDAELAEMRSNGGDDNNEPDDVIDITDSGCTITRDMSADSPYYEGISNLIDNNITSKYLIFTNNTWIRLNCESPSVVKTYRLTSGNDAPERDPKNWHVLGSNNGLNWYILDSRFNEFFTARRQTLQYQFENTYAYKYYKFEFENNGGDLFQLSEIELFNGIPM